MGLSCVVIIPYANKAGEGSIKYKKAGCITLAMQPVSCTMFSQMRLKRAGEVAPLYAQSLAYARPIGRVNLIEQGKLAVADLGWNTGHRCGQITEQALTLPLVK